MIVNFSLTGLQDALRVNLLLNFSANLVESCRILSNFVEWDKESHLGNY